MSARYLVSVTAALANALLATGCLSVTDAESRHGEMAMHKECMKGHVHAPGSMDGQNGPAHQCPMMRPNANATSSDGDGHSHSDGSAPQSKVEQHE